MLYIFLGIEFSFDFNSFTQTQTISNLVGRDEARAEKGNYNINMFTGHEALIFSSRVYLAIEINNHEPRGWSLDRCYILTA